jgi:hypothetical protein
MKGKILVILTLSVSIAANFAEGTTIIVTPVLLPVKASPSWVSAADKLITCARADSIVTNTSVTNPTDYAVCSYRVNWLNLVYSTGTPLWNAVLNPPAPFAQELGQVVWNLIDARSNSGNDDLSLDMLSFTSFSNDGNYLGDIITWNGMAYTQRAIAIKKGGSIISSGSTSQKGNRILVLAYTKLFNGGGTQAGLDQVRSWIAGFGNYYLNYTAQIIGDDSTKSFATIATTGVPPSPILKINGSDILILNNNAKSTYQIFSSTQLPVNTWQFEEILNGSNVWHIKFSDNFKLYRAKVQ